MFNYKICVKIIQRKTVKPPCSFLVFSQMDKPWRVLATRRWPRHAWVLLSTTRPAPPEYRSLHHQHQSEPIPHPHQQPHCCRQPLWWAITKCTSFHCLHFFICCCYWGCLAKQVQASRLWPGPGFPTGSFIDYVFCCWRVWLFASLSPVLTSMIICLNVSSWKVILYYKKCVFVCVVWKVWYLAGWLKLFPCGGVVGRDKGLFWWFGPQGLPLVVGAMR